MRESLQLDFHIILPNLFRAHYRGPHDYSGNLAETFFRRAPKPPCGINTNKSTAIPKPCGLIFMGRLGVGQPFLANRVKTVLEYKVWSADLPCYVAEVLCLFRQSPMPGRIGHSSVAQKLTKNRLVRSWVVGRPLIQLVHFTNHRKAMPHLLHSDKVGDVIVIRLMQRSVPNTGT